LMIKALLWKWWSSRGFINRPCGHRCRIHHRNLVRWRCPAGWGRPQCVAKNGFKYNFWLLKLVLYIVYIVGVSAQLSIVPACVFISSSLWSSCRNILISNL
jgi:hypothetical protein